jgi:hypothetical protein
MLGIMWDIAARYEPPQSAKVARHHLVPASCVKCRCAILGPFVAVINNKDAAHRHRGGTPAPVGCHPLIKPPAAAVWARVFRV